MLVETDGTVVATIDDVEPTGGSKFRLLPGPHRLELYLNDANMGGGLRTSRITLPVCFTGRAGHAYLARPSYAGHIWRPQIIDENLTYPVASNDCSPPRPALARAPVQAAPAPTPTPAREAAPPAAAAPPDGGAAAGESPATASAETPPSPAAATAVPREGAPAAAETEPIAAPAADTETPRAAVRTAASTGARSDATMSRPFEPRAEFSSELGVVQGGEELITAMTNTGSRETLGTGDGLLLTIGARFTPFWISHTVGFGLGGSYGIKYWSVGSSGAEASMFKYLVTGSGHVLLSVEPTWLLVFQGGVERDLGIDLSINGTSTGVPFESRTGFVGVFAVQHALDDNWSFAFSLRVTILSYTLEGTPVGANSVGAAFSMHYSL